MKKDLLHTPEGVRDIYGKECLEKRKIIRNQLSLADMEYNPKMPDIKVRDL